MSREKFHAYMALHWKLNGIWPDSESVWNAAISEHENQIETLRGVVVGYKQRIAELEKDCEILQTNLDAALKKVSELSEANQFWLYDDPETSFANSLENLLNETFSNVYNDPADFVGQEYRVMLSKSFPDIWVKITGVVLDADGDVVNFTHEIKVAE
jgi:hypothetical protein